MRTVLLASLRHNRRRYVASALAVVIGVAFIVAVNGLAGALRSGMTADTGRSFAGADWVVDTSEPEVAERVVESVVADGGAATGVWTGWTTARSGERTLDDLSVATVADDERLQWQEVVDGRLPASDGEAVLGERAAVELDLGVGDTVTFGAGSQRFDVAVVGVVGDHTQGRASLYLRSADAERTGALWLDHVVVVGDRDAIGDEDASVMTKDDYVTDLQAQITQGVDVIALMVTVFAAIALGVAILVITNTFAILFAQRARDFALLRCVGVTKKQLRRSVRVESLVLGILSSLVGAVLGVALAFGLSALAGVWVDVLGPASFQPAWVLGALLIGVLVTVVAAWLPTRAVTRIAPLAALRPQGGIDARSRAGVLRTVLGVLVLVAGVALLALVVALTGAQDGPDVAILLPGMLAGGAAAFVGVLLLGPFLVPTGLRLLGRLVSRRGARGAVTRLATSNSVRNPRRTATTAASLMVGVTLTTAVLTGLTSVNRSLDAEMEVAYPLDVAVVPAQASESDVDALLDEVGRVDGVDRVQKLTAATVTVDGADLTLVAVTGTEDVLRAADETIWNDRRAEMPYEMAMGLGESVQDNEDGSMVLQLGIGETARQIALGYGDAYGATTVAVQPSLLTELVAAGTAQQQPGVIWVRAADGADPAELDTALTKAAVAAGVKAELAGEFATRDFIGTQFTVITAAVVGLLSIAVLIALIGIGNTLGLSVLERGQENALLRAMGLTKVQLRRTLAWEGVMLAVVATVMGIAIGIAFAWVGVKVLVGAMMLETNLSIPFWQLGVVVVVSVLAGVLASVVPARKAAKVSPAEGLSLA